MQEFRSTMSLMGRYCCKSLFAPGFKKSAGYRRDFRVKMRGASSPHVKLTGDFGNAIEIVRIGECFPFLVSREIRRPATFDFCNTIGQKPTNHRELKLDQCPLLSESGQTIAAQRLSAWCRYCCKSLFALLIKNSLGSRCDFGINM